MQEFVAAAVSEGAESRDVLSVEEKRRLTKRVVNSHEFSGSQAMRSFLLYVTEHAILGRTEKLKEQTIGTEVLGRKPDYDPAIDNIVRVRARELRGRLAKYFETEGANEPILITIPKGSYAPEFLPRTRITVDPPAAPLITEHPIVVKSEAHPVAQNRFLIYAIFLIVLLASIVITRYAVRPSNRVNSVPLSGAVHDFWGQFFDKPEKELRIVYADTSFGLWQDMSSKTVDLGSYLSHKYLEDQNDKFREIATRRSTSPADLLVSVNMATLAGELGGRVSAQFARNANADFLHHGNIVLIGSHRSNPWVEEYEPNLNFQLKQDPVSGAPLYLNRSPQSKEASTYAIPNSLDMEGDEQKEFISYGVIALLKICGEQSFVVLDEGLNMQATQAMGDQLTDPQMLDALLHSIGHKPGKNVEPFEALVQITSLPGGYDGPKVVAVRSHSKECVAR